MKQEKKTFFFLSDIPKTKDPDAYQSLLPILMMVMNCRDKKYVNETNLTKLNSTNRYFLIFQVSDVISSSSLQHGHCVPVIRSNDLSSINAQRILLQLDNEASELNKILSAYYYKTFIQKEKKYSGTLYWAKMIAKTNRLSTLSDFSSRYPVRNETAAFVLV